MKRIISITIILALGISLCSCSAKWTDEDITKSTKIEITKYESDNPNIKVIYTITDEDVVNSFTNKFSEFEVKDTDIYVRVTVVSKDGKHACTNAYFVDDLLKD